MIKIVEDRIYSALGKWPSRKWNRNVRRAVAEAASELLVKLSEENGND